MESDTRLGLHRGIGKGPYADHLVRPPRPLRDARAASLAVVMESIMFVPSEARLSDPLNPANAGDRQPSVPFIQDLDKAPHAGRERSKVSAPSRLEEVGKGTVRLLDLDERGASRDQVVDQLRGVHAPDFGHAPDALGSAQAPHELFQDLQVGTKERHMLGELPELMACEISEAYTHVLPGGLEKLAPGDGESEREKRLFGSLQLLDPNPGAPLGFEELLQMGPPDAFDAKDAPMTDDERGELIRCRALKSGESFTDDHLLECLCETAARKKWEVSSADCDRRTDLPRSAQHLGADIFPHRSRHEWPSQIANVPGTIRVIPPARRRRRSPRDRSRGL